MCFPVTSHGPFGSIPPVETMAVVFPEAIASRTSIHVISSIQAVFASGRGLGVSEQLYSFARQSPPPIVLGSGAGRCWPPGPAPRPRPPLPAPPWRCGAGRVPPFAIVSRISPAVLSARNPTICLAYSRDLTRSAMETPLIDANPAATRSSNRIDLGSAWNILSAITGSS